VKAGIVLEAEPLTTPQEYTDLRKIVEGDSMFHDRQDRMEAVDWLDYWMGWQFTENLDFLKFDGKSEPNGTPVQALLESKYPREVAALKEYNKRFNNFVPAREILSGAEPALGISLPEQSGIPAKGIYVEKAANSFNHYDDAMVGAVYVDGKMVAYIPKNNQGLGEIAGSGAKLLGVDPERPFRFIYLNREGKVVSIDPKRPGELLAKPEAASENAMVEGVALEQRRPSFQEKVSSLRDKLISAVKWLKLNLDDSSARTEIEDYLKQTAEPFRELRLNDDNWKAEFGENETVDSVLGKLTLGIGFRGSMVKERRLAFFGLIKPTIQSPNLVLAKPDGSFLMIKSFIGKTRIGTLSQWQGIRLVLQSLYLSTRTDGRH
jgi:hypothetical protein